MIDIPNLKIVVHPHESLRKKCEPIAEITDEVKAVAARMLELMTEAEGIGLAAPQVGLPWQMFVMDYPGQDWPKVYINPVMASAFGEPETNPEGCLSLPGMVCDVARRPTVTITAQGLDGKEFSTFAGGLVSRCWQHEFDHLMGILILDRAIGKPRKREDSLSNEPKD